MKLKSNYDRTNFKNGSINSYIARTKLWHWKIMENTDILHRNGAEVPPRF